MSANSIPTPDWSRPAHRFRTPIKAVCARHGIPCGSPDALAQFLPALIADKHLAMDFWSLIARLTDRPGSDFADPDCLLADIVEVITGQNLADARAAGPSQQILIGKLAAMLAGEDTLEPVAAAPPVPHSSRDGDHHPPLVLRYEPPFAAAMDRSIRERESDLSPQPPEPPIATPFVAFAEASEHSASVLPKLVGGILLGLAAGGVLLLYHGNWTRLGTSIHTQYAAAVAKNNHATAQTATSISGGQGNFTVNPAASPTEPQPAAAPSNPVPPEPVTPQKPTPIAVATIVPPPKDTAALTRQPHTDAQIVVPEALMRQNLVSSRVPIFPQGATGPVVIQAIVTAGGTVEPLRAVSGDPALAHAAMAAAAAWRYRPYLQNGVPVNVSTTISIGAAGNE